MIIKRLRLIYALIFALSISQTEIWRLLLSSACVYIKIPIETRKHTNTH